MQHLKIETAEKQKLNTYIYGTENAQTAIIFCHGFSGNSSGLFKPQLAEELSHKYLVCRFDFRGQGNSDGKFHDTSITHELEDLDCVVAYVRRQYSPEKIVLLGHSFGAAVALLYASQNKIDGLVSLSGEGDLEKAVIYEFTEKQLEDLRTRGETLVENWSEDGDENLLGKQFLDDMLRYSTTDAAKKLQCPILFIHGKNDDVIPYDATEKMYKLVRSPKEIKLMENTDHTYNFFTNKPKTKEVFSNIKDWLDKYF